jgi:cysteine desulfurase/selenocysteine lyase
MNTSEPVTGLIPGAALEAPGAELANEIARLANQIFNGGSIQRPTALPIAGAETAHFQSPTALAQAAGSEALKDSPAPPDAFVPTGLALGITHVPPGGGSGGALGSTEPYFMSLISGTPAAAAVPLGSLPSTQAASGPAYDLSNQNSTLAANAALPDNTGLTQSPAYPEAGGIAPGAAYPESAASPRTASPAVSSPEGSSAPGAAASPTHGAVPKNLAVPQTTALPAAAPEPTLEQRVPGSSFGIESLELPGANDTVNLSPVSGLFSAEAVRRDFPILREKIHGKRLIWLDNAATTQKPQSVIDRISYFYEHENSNVHRAAHTLAARSTDAYEGARDRVKRFLNAGSNENIVFTRGATEAINLVAKSWGARYVTKGDEILVTHLEHHANIVPWQQLAQATGATLRVAPVDDRGQVKLDEFERLLNSRTRLVAFAHVSNALGTILPIQQMVEMAHRHGAKVLVDGAQAVSHLRVDVQAIDCDWYCFSGHKVFGPTGIGALYGKPEILAVTPPWQGGGNMIQDVTFEKTQFQPPPWRFEAGTGNIADAVGLGAAIDYVSQLGLENIARHEHELLEYGTEQLRRVPGLRILGTAPEKAGVLSFVIDGLRTEEMSAALDLEGIAVRSGHHCAQPILRRFGLESTVRASLAPYNTCEDLDALVEALLRLAAGSSGRVSS